MTIKTTTDGDTVTTETMADRLRAVQSEPWRKMRYTDENDEAAWEVYNESLFLRPKGAEGEQEQEQEQEQPKEGEEQPTEPGQGLEESVAHFTTKWGDKELLEAVSGIKKETAPEVQIKRDPEPVQAKKVKQLEAAAEEAARPKATPSPRTRGGGAIGAKRGARPRAPSTRTG